MKQKTVIKVYLNCEKCRTKAMEAAATTPGVTSLSIEGKDKDELVIIGDEVDVVGLTSLLRKKIRFANIVSVQEVKNEKKPDEKPKSKSESEKKSESNPPIIYQYPYYYPQLFTY